MNRPANQPRDHGGGLDAAIAQFGGTRADWIDLSTGINPTPYQHGPIAAHHWTALPDKAAITALTDAARAFWNVPDGAAILATPGASSLIARIPALTAPATVDIPTPTYNEHAAAFAANDWSIGAENPVARVLVHPNNPTGHWYKDTDITAPLTIIDESFCDVAPERSLIAHAGQPGRIILKSFGKFWGLAGLRLGFAIGDPVLSDKLSVMFGPWPVAGPALVIGAQALRDTDWADATRARLGRDATRLDDLMTGAKANVIGGTPLFRLYDVDDAARWQIHLAKHHIWSRIFPYSPTMLRLGLPDYAQWPQLAAALKVTA